MEKWKEARRLILKKIKEAPVVRRPRGNPGSAHNLYYKNVIAAFDIETSYDEETNQNYIYSWAFCVDNEKYYIQGRTWEEFIKFKEDIKEASGGAAVPVYVHYLSYEFQFLAGVLDFKSNEVLCGKKREILKAYNEPFEFRCSYKLTGMSLEAFTEKMEVKHVKLSSGKYNHTKIRYPWTPLNDEEKAYIKNDVVGLVEAIKKIMEIYKDTIYTIPITQVGYTRRQIKKRMRTYPWDKVNDQKINYDIYKDLNIAMRGGNAHAGRYISGEIIPQVECWDISSAYPAAVVYGMYPIGKWFKDPAPDLDHMLKLIYARNRAVIATLRFKNIRVKRRTEQFPYITDNQAKTFYDEDKTVVKSDNGRILAARGYITGVYTDLDIKIILEQYDFEEIEVISLLSTKYGRLPNQIREYVLELYEKKTKLKGDKKSAYETTKIEINSIFGMFAEDPGKTYYMYIDGDFIKEDISKEEAVTRKVEKSSLSYAWGIWTTAIVRSWIQAALNELGLKAYYVDTDGIKCAKGNKAVFDKHNAMIEEAAKDIKGAAVPDLDGVIHTLGMFEYEGIYDEFITLGSKKYAYKKGKEINIATAGVNKKTGGKELKSLKNYHEGFTFTEAAGSEAIYNDDVDMYIEREGQKIHITRNVVLLPSKFTLGLTEEYKRLVLYPELVERFLRRDKHVI